MEKGFLSKKDERWLRKVLDHVCRLKGLAEVVDGPGFGLIISVADNHVIEKYLPIEQKNLLVELIKLGKEKNTEAIQKLIIERFKLTNPLIISLEQMALNFILSAIYEWAVNIEQEMIDADHDEDFIDSVTL